MLAKPRSAFGSSAAAALLVTLAAFQAHACPDCPTARVVRASVFDAAFLPNLALVSAPLLVIIAIVVRLYRIGLHSSSPATRRQP